MSENLSDILAENLSVIFCGINPAKTAAVSSKHLRPQPDLPNRCAGRRLSPDARRRDGIEAIAGT
jgi:hypothetical protein